MQKEGSDKKTVAGKYIVYMSQPLGKGTFATTYTCRVKNDPSQILACKLMNKKQISGIIDDLDYLIHRVKDQVNAWKQLIHPNIVRFEGCQETANNIYFFLQYCSGGSLDAYIAKNLFKIDVNQIKKYMKQLISACAYLENKKIVHRDIKPANILIKGDQIKLGDFGLARAINSNDGEHLKSFFTFAGTLHYMAPQIIKCQKYPYKCDVWSVGITIFMMFTGQLPFGMVAKDNSQKVILQKIQLNKQQFSQHIFQRQPEVKNILQMMLNPDPQKRPFMSDILKIIQKW